MEHMNIKRIRAQKRKTLNSGKERLSVFSPHAHDH